MAAASFTLRLLILILLLSRAASETPPPDDYSPSPSASASASFRPGITVVVCVLTTMFSLTSLMLLYIKHCNGATAGGGSGNSAAWAAAPLEGRKNSGIERSVVESLPVFRFGALRGQKEGLDCAVCLTRFEAAEVLRLLPKCKHAFHVECVDTWLDAHSTCPLCRYRVDPEDVLLVEKEKEKEKRSNEEREGVGKRDGAECDRRHSSVGERGTEQRRSWTASFRRSLDSATSRKGWFVRGSGSGSGRKDGMLLTQETEQREERRLEHRIIVSPGPLPLPGPGPLGVHQRWSDVVPSDLLYLTSEMIMSENTHVIGIINSRSVSEITGLSRFSTNNNHRREEGLVKRWLLSWIWKS